MEYTEDQYSLLSKMSGGLYVDWWETSSEEWAIIEFLESEGLCSVAGPREFGTWTLTQKGMQALAIKENFCRQNAQKERQNRTQNKYAKLGIFVSLIIFILGLVFELIRPLIGWVN